MSTNNSINVNSVTPLSVVKGGTGLAAITANQILYSSDSNVIAGLTTANNGVLITNNTGVPSLLANSSTAGYVLTANAGAPPSWQAGTGGGITTINANTGSITGTTVTINGGTTGLTTSGSSATMSLTGTLALANGGTNASLTASNGGIFYSTGSAGAILSGTATAGQILRSGANAAPSWSTATYPASAGTLGNVLVSDGTNFVSSAPAASGVVTINGSTGSITGTTVTINGGTTGLTTTGSSTTMSIGGTLVVANGGTGLASATAYGIIAGGTTSTGAFQSVATGTANQILLSGGAAALPSWSTATYPASAGTTGNILTSDGTNFVSSAPAGITISGNAGSVTGTSLTLNGGTTGLTTSGSSTTMSLTGTLALANGGTNASLTASNGGIFYSTGSAGAILAGTATAGQILRSGTSAAPSWSTTTYPATNAVNTLLYASSANVMAALATANSAMLVTNSSGVPTWSGTMTDGQVIIGTTSGTPVAATLTAGTNISITNAAGSITINASGGLTWTTTASTSVAAAVNNAYIANVGTLCTVTLPSTCAIGQVVAVEGLGAGGWRLAANTGQTIKIGSSTTTSAGSLSSTAISDNVYVVCIVANTTWRVQTTNSAGLDIL